MTCLAGHYLGLASHWVPVTLSEAASVRTPHEFRDILVEEKAKIREMSQQKSVSNKFIKATERGTAKGGVSVPIQQSQGSQSGTCTGWAWGAKAGHRQILSVQSQAWIGDRASGRWAQTE